MPAFRATRLPTQVRASACAVPWQEQPGSDRRVHAGMGVGDAATGSVRARGLVLAHTISPM